MKIIYETVDGTQFLNEDDCLDYEFKLEFQNLKTINIYNAHGEGLETLSSPERAYDESDIVVIHNKDELRDLNAVGQEYGLCSFADEINDIGTFVWNYDICKFEKAPEDFSVEDMDYRVRNLRIEARNKTLLRDTIPVEWLEGDTIDYKSIKDHQYLNDLGFETRENSDCSFSVLGLPGISPTSWGNWGTLYLRDADDNTILIFEKMYKQGIIKLWRSHKITEKGYELVKEEKL